MNQRGKAFRPTMTLGASEVKRLSERQGEKGNPLSLLGTMSSKRGFFFALRACEGVIWLTGRIDRAVEVHWSLCT